MNTESSGPRADLRAYSPSQVLAVLFDADGLHLASSPKGLVPFHRYRSETRTALTEHLVEAAKAVLVFDETVLDSVFVDELRQMATIFSRKCSAIDAKSLSLWSNRQWCSSAVAAMMQSLDFQIVMPCLRSFR